MNEWRIIGFIGLLVAAALLLAWKGDWGRPETELEKAMRRMREGMGEMQEAMGLMLLPTIKKATRQMADLARAFENL